MRTKRLFTLALVLLMIFTSILPVMASVGGTPVTGQEQQAFDKSNLPKLADDQRNSKLSDEEQVRIIVQLDSAPLVDYAIQKGVMVDELSPNLVARVTNDLYATQESVKKDIEKKDIEMVYHENFLNIINGFSGTTTYAEAKEIENLPGVKSVYIANEYQRPTPDMSTSVDIINARETWNLGYKGEGLVAAIIDTGIDSTHKDMKLTDNATAKLNKSDVNGLIASKNLPGKFFTIKVPYGYNYYDNNLEIRDLGPDATMHGMHVAGTVGANGDAKGIKGVAPEIQLLAMKVFGNDPGMSSTFGDIIIRAIDDSVKLGADVINMSLGSTASYVLPNDPEQQAVTNAANAGVLLSISAGNSNKFGSGYGLPYNSNPDTGVVGSPGLTAESLQVASIENTHVKAYALEYSLESETKLAGYFTSGAADPVIVFAGKPVEYVDCGLGGTAADFAGKNLTGKIALIKRGGYDFTAKIANAEAAGAAGVIVWNHEAGGEALVSMMYPEGGTIPAVFITNSHGAALLGLAGTDKAKISFKGNQTTVLNSNIGKMSDFTSWGPTPDLEFKPEITAPGGQIYSTFNDNKYGIMSGTSMAAPHVAGGSALALERVTELFPELTGLNKVNMAKNILMSTAHPLTDKGTYNVYYESGSFYSPRSQGAGVMDVFAAVKTPAVVYDKNSGLSKVNLKEIGDKTNFVITVNNFGDEPVTYSVSANAQTDLMRNGAIQAESDLIFVDGTIDQNSGLGEAPLQFTGLDGSEITVPANSTIDIPVELDLSNTVDWFYNAPVTELFPNGTFVEGFVQLTAVDDNTPSLSIPYVGFYGEWDQAPVIDGDVYGLTGDTYYEYSGLLTPAEGDYEYLIPVLAQDIAEFAISPNGDGKADQVLPIVSFLRNAKTFSVDIYSGDGEKLLRHIAGETDLRKHYYDNKRGPLYTFKSSWAWDGAVKNKVTDGDYILRITAAIDYPGAQPQVINYPVVVDTVAPVITRNQYNLGTGILTIEAEDATPIIDYSLFDADSHELIAASQDGTFDLNEYKNSLLHVYVVATDAALNKTTSENIYLNDNQIASIFMNSPEPFGIYSTNTIAFDGYVTDASGLNSLKINNVDVPFVLDPQTGRFNFHTEMTFEDGLHKIDVDAVDKAGNAINFERTIYVDTHAPEITMTQIPEERVVENEVESVVLQGTVTDMFSFLRVKVDGSEVYYNPDESEYADRFTTPANYDLNEEIALDEGENIITIETQDVAGNTSRKTYKVYRKAVGEETPDLDEAVSITALNVLSGTNVSAERPVTISATANQDVEWTVTIKNPNGSVEATYQQTGSVFEESWAPSPFKKLNGQYKVSIVAVNGEDMATEQTSFTVYNYAIKINSVNVTNRNGVISAEAGITNLGPSAANPMLIVQVLDASGHVVNISTARMDGMLAQQTVGLSSGFGLTKAGTYTVEVFVWSGWADAEALSTPATATFVLE